MVDHAYEGKKRTNKLQRATAQFISRPVFEIEIAMTQVIVKMERK